jgi:hypothetical protein
LWRDAFIARLFSVWNRRKEKKENEELGRFPFQSIYSMAI